MLRMCQPLNLLPCAAPLGCKSLWYGVQLYLQSLPVCACHYTVTVTELCSRQEQKFALQGLQQEEPAPRRQRARVDAHAVAAVYDGLVRSGFLEEDVKQALQVPLRWTHNCSRSSLLFAASLLLTVRLWLCTSPQSYCYAGASCCGQPGS